MPFAVGRLRPRSGRVPGLQLHGNGPSFALFAAQSAALRARREAVVSLYYLGGLTEGAETIACRAHDCLVLVCAVWVFGGCAGSRRQAHPQAGDGVFRILIGTADLTQSRAETDWGGNKPTVVERVLRAARTAPPFASMRVDPPSNIGRTSRNPGGGGRSHAVGLPLPASETERSAMLRGKHPSRLPAPLLLCSRSAAHLRPPPSKPGSHPRAAGRFSEHLSPVGGAAPACRLAQRPRPPAPAARTPSRTAGSTDVLGSRERLSATYGSGLGRQGFSGNGHENRHHGAPVAGLAPLVPP